MPKKGNAYLDGTVHVGKEVQTIQRYKLEPYMWEKRYEPVTGTVHVGKCFPIKTKRTELQKIFGHFISPISLDELVFRMKMTFNPWDVSSAAVFLKYCCPECDYQVWQYRLLNFQGRDTKLESFFG